MYKYDPVGNLTNVVYASGQTPAIVLNYDGLNRLTNMMDAAGTTAFGWTPGNQLASEDGPWADDKISYSYLHRLRGGLSLAQPNASAWAQSYVYDDMMRLTELASPAGAFTFVYSGTWDRPYQITLPNVLGPNTVDIQNSYDGLARLTDTYVRKYPSIIFNRHQYGYNEGNQRTQQVFTAGNYVNYSYDAIGQLKTAKGWEDDGTTARLHEQFGYAYDKAWNLQHRTNNALLETFNVDDRNQLTDSGRSGTFTVAGTATEPKGGYSYWGYPSGVTNVVVSGTGLSSGAAELYLDGSWARPGATLANGNNSYTATAEDTYNRTSTDSVTVNIPAAGAFVYDLNGNLRTNGTRIFDYDDENQLTRITEPGKWKSEFTYDGMMRRRVRKEFTWSSAIGNWQLASETRYVYDGRLVIQERDANNLPQVSYTRGNDLSGSLEGAGGIGGLLARTENSKFITQNSEAHAYYHADDNGNVTALINTNGAIVARYHYDPYGNILSMSGPLAEANLYRFSSKEQHVSSGLSYYLYRYYSASLQRWVNRDPIGEMGFEQRRGGPPNIEGSGANTLAFVDNRPTTAMDAFGLFLYPGVWPGSPNPPRSPERIPIPKGPQFEPNKWNKNDNCLAYALNRPGLGILNPWEGEYTDNASSCGEMEKYMRNKYNAKPSSYFGDCPAGYRKIKMYPGYHFQRQDADGSWSEKDVYGAPRKCNTGTFIAYPIDKPESDVDKPQKPCGYLCIPN